MQPPVQTKAEVLARLRAAAPDLRALGVERLGLFGSFVRDEATPESDVDVLVDFAAGRKTFRALCAVGDLLEERLGRTVEIVTRRGLSPYIGPHILATTQDALATTF
jgi:uncharacterized protein